MSCNHLYDCPRCSDAILDAGDAVEKAKAEKEIVVAKLLEAVQFAQAQCRVDDKTIQEWIWATGLFVDKKGNPVKR